MYAASGTAQYVGTLLSNAAIAGTPIDTICANSGFAALVPEVQILVMDSRILSIYGSTLNRTSTPWALAVSDGVTNTGKIFVDVQPFSNVISPCWTADVSALVVE